MEASLTQGRWHANFMPRVNHFAIDPEDLQFSVYGFDSHEPGFKMELTSGEVLSLTEDQKEKVFGAMSQLMGVAIFE
jgi:hypothetical protein